MPGSIGNQTLDLQNLVVNAKANAADVPGLDVHLAPLEQVVADTKDLNARLEMRKGIKQDETQERKALLVKGRKLAARVRAALKAHFGINSERLVQFGARPVRPRTNKVQTPGQPGPAPQPPTPVPTGKP